MCYYFFFFFFKQKTAYEMRISDWSSDVCSSDLLVGIAQHFQYEAAAARPQRDKLFLPAQCQLAEPDLLCAFQGFAQDDIGFFGKLVGGNDIIGLGIIEDVDRVEDRKSTRLNSSH